jgi:hypothetical protein
VSAYVTDALIRQLEHDRLGDLLDELADLVIATSDPDDLKALIGDEKRIAVVPADRL